MAQPQRIQPDLHALHLRALNKDNAQESLQVVHLLEETYGGVYPYHDWYHPSAWLADETSEHAPEPVTGMLVVEDQEIVGHLAYRKPGNLCGIELLLPAIDVQQEEISASVEELFWSKLQYQAERQGWQFAFLCVPLKNLSRCFEGHALSRGVPTALLPARNGDEALVIISFELHRPNPDPSRAYIHPHCTPVAEFVYDRFRLARDLIPSRYRVSMRCDDEYPAPPASRHGTRRFQWHFDTVAGLGFLPPIELADRSRQYAERVGRCGKTLVLSLPVSSPRYAAMCGALLAEGFQVCGVLPGCNGSDRVILSDVNCEQFAPLRTRAEPVTALRDVLSEVATS